MVFAAFALCAGCAKEAGKSTTPGSGFPSAPFTFEAIPVRLRERINDNGEGRYRSYQMRVLAVRQGSLSEKEIDFFFPEEALPPLEIGRRYLFTAMNDQHGIVYTDWKKIEEPNLEGSAAPERAADPG